ncbi:ABC transporter ATP-binding protein [Symbiobacterium thermophilum]|uniref:ABC transporter domain-containing protein n=1 Tax=Symbiobacterium thermophilum TaxID=2734 RepID=A0A953IB47_SYMTR|nr:ABC transporter ATP-binding protein [Symbiobacterium thermophilum]MBY6277783.1 hypothetical protein [Symbiobacterium thermophilum]
MLEVHHLRKSYGDKVAVQDLSFHVPRGSITAFLGPNGAGKTTTLRMILGLLRRDQGAIHIDGHDVDVHPEIIYQQTGYVPDSPNVYSHLTGREFLTFVAELRRIKLSPEAVQQRLEEFGLKGHEDYLASTYSLGMKKRLMLAAALLHNPSLLILDEPTSGLDPVGIRFLKDLLRKVTAGGGAVLMSTHLLPSAQEVADRVLIIHKGRLLLETELTEVLRTGGNLEETFMSLINIPA